MSMPTPERSRVVSTDHRTTGYRQYLRRGLVVAVLVAVLMACGDPGFDIASGRLSNAEALLAILVVTALVGLRRALVGPAPMDSVFFYALSSALLVLPSFGEPALLLMVVASALLTLDLGVTAALIAGAAVTAAAAVSCTVRFDFPVHTVLLQSVVLLMITGMAAGTGLLMAQLDRARFGLERANEALRRTRSYERDLVLAEERSRSARELHDGLGHRMTLTAMELEYAMRMRNRDPDRAWDEIALAARTTRDALQEVRMWARALDPVPLRGASDVEAIAASFRGTGLDVSVRHEGRAGSLGRDASLFATRFIQEGLTNVLRHSGAARVEIDVRLGAEGVMLSIGDDGVGGCGADAGFGLRSLRERAELLGGRIRSGSSELGGFELVAVVPVAEDA